jgi:hypothetical protein
MATETNCHGATEGAQEKLLLVKYFFVFSVSLWQWFIRNVFTLDDVAGIRYLANVGLLAK